MQGRAGAELDRGDVVNALASMASDVRKHAEMDTPAVTMLLATEGMRLAAAGDVAGLRRFIEGSPVPGRRDLSVVISPELGLPMHPRKHDDGGRGVGVARSDGLAEERSPVDGWSDLAVGAPIVKR